jgi:hypothetical protein
MGVVYAHERTIGMQMQLRNLHLPKLLSKIKWYALEVVETIVFFKWLWHSLFR